MADNRREKRRSNSIGECIICHQVCNEDKSTTTAESWETLRCHAKNWEGLDKFGTLYEKVQWENGPQGVYFHKLCRTKIASKVSLSQALKRKKLEVTNESTRVFEILDQTQSPSQRYTSSILGPTHNKNLCVW